MKRNTWKKTIAFVMAFTLVAGTMPANVGGFLTGGTAIVASAEVTNDEWGNGINYSYDSDTGTLTLTATDSGTVVKPSGVVCYDNHGEMTINPQFSGIRKIVISEGITQIDSEAFANWKEGNKGTFNNGITVEIPSTVTNIGRWAFSSMTLGSLSVVMNRGPEGLTINKGAFNGANNGENQNGTFTTPYAEAWKTDSGCIYDSATNILKIGNVDYLGTFTLEATPVPYLTWDDVSKTLVDKSGGEACVNYTTVTNSTSTSWSDGWYVVSDDVTISNRITVNGTVNLILKDGAKLTVKGGINLTGGNTLNIYGQTAGTGQLSTTNVGNSQAGIGGNTGQSGGILNVYGGTITATGGPSAAGIGGGASDNAGGSGGTVNIYGGTVTANGGESAAGIGGGASKKAGGAGGTVNIYGGTVTANGGKWAAGIGGGASETAGGAGGTVNIYGGTVTAKGGQSAAGIGGGASAGVGGDGGTVIIKNGLTVKAGSDANNTQKVTNFTDFATNHKQGYAWIGYPQVPAEEPLVIGAGSAFKVGGAVRYINVVGIDSSSQIDLGDAVAANTLYTVNAGGNGLSISADGLDSTSFPEFAAASAKTYLVTYSNENGDTLELVENKVYKNDSIDLTQLKLGDVVTVGAVLGGKSAYLQTVDLSTVYVDSGSEGGWNAITMGGATSTLAVVDPPAVTFANHMNAFVLDHITEGKYYFNQTYVDITTASIKTNPTAATNLTFNGQPQNLITAGSATGGTMEYRDTTLIPKESSETLAVNDVKIGNVYKPTGDAKISFPAGYAVSFYADTTLNTYTAETNTVYSFKFNGSDTNNPYIEIYKNTEATRMTCFRGDALRILAIDADSKNILFEVVNSADYTDNWSTEIPKGTYAGEYTISYRVKGDANHFDLVGAERIPVNIAKGYPLKTAPTSKNPTLYSSAVQLINAGTVEKGCKIEYALGTDATTAPTNGWETDATKITANKSGTFYVWYKVTGTTNYADVSATPVPVTVSQYTAPVVVRASQTWTLSLPSYIYDGTAHEVEIIGETYGKIIYYYYNADTNEKLDEAPSEIGNYRVRIYTSGDANYYSRSQSAEYSITEPAASIDENGMASVEKFKNSDTIPTVEGKIFAGWFTDSTCTTPYTEDSGKAYAKFIDEKILTVKAQISSGTTANSEKTSIRFITSVDSLKYQNVGFKITYNGKTIDKQMTKVYTALNANGKKISPKVFSEESNYMEAYMLNNIPQSAFSKEFMVTPYYTTQDGTIVEGKTNTFTIANMIK